MTRTRSSIRLPDTLLPRDFTPSALIQLIKTKKDPDPREAAPGSSRTASYRKGWSRSASGKAPAKSYTGIRRSFKDAYKPWTRAADEELLELYRQDLSIADIARQIERQPSAIMSRLRKLGIFYNED